MEYAKEETAPWYDALDDDHDALDLVINQIYERIIGSQWTFDNEEDYVKAFATKGYIDREWPSLPWWRALVALKDLPRQTLPSRTH